MYLPKNSINIQLIKSDMIQGCSKVKHIYEKIQRSFVKNIKKIINLLIIDKKFIIFSPTRDYGIKNGVKCTRNTVVVLNQHETRNGRYVPNLLNLQWQVF